MPVSDYAHHNEEAMAIWWQEEGRHDDLEPPDPDEDVDVFDDYEDWEEEDADE